MTSEEFEKRMASLTERHEALTQSVELLRLEGEAQGKRTFEQGRNIDKLISAAQKDGENIAALARIAEMHEKRIEDLKS